MTTEASPLRLGVFTFSPPQEAAVYGWREGKARGHRCMIAQLPTGVGKTILALFLAREEGRALFVVSRKKLLRQTVEKAKIGWPEAQVGVIHEDRREWWAKDLLVTTVQTAVRRLDHGWGEEPIKLVIVDEAHHAASTEHLRLLAWLEARYPGVLVLGLTATPNRHDGVNLRSAGFTAYCYRMHLEEALRYGYVTPLRVEQTPIERFDLSKVKVDRRTGDYEKKSLLRELKAAHIAEQAARIYAERVGAKRRGLIFTADVEQAVAVAQELNRLGVPAAAVSGDTDEDEQERLLGDLRAGRLAVIANCALWTEGFDEPSVDVGMLARPTRSKGLLHQMLGRILRLHPGKTEALFFDLWGAYEKLGLIMRAQDLVEVRKVAREGGDEDEEDEDDLEVIGEFVPDGEEVEENDDLSPMAESLLALAPNTVARHFSSRLAHWLPCSRALYALRLGPSAFLVMRETREGWVGETVEERGLPEIVAGPAEDVSLVQGLAEGLARERGALSLTAKDALWRSREPSQAQLRRLSELDTIWAPGLTQGEASDLISAARVREFYGRTG